MQFWGSQSDAAYAVFENAYLQVDGELVVEGTADKPVILTPSDLFNYRSVAIENKGKVINPVCELMEFSIDHVQLQ